MSEPAPTGAAGWSHFEHGADIGVRGIGDSPAAAFAQAALALTAVVTDPAGVAAREEARFSCTAPDLELLLVDWLNALIGALATRGLLCSEFDVVLDGTRLQATARGETVDVTRHAPAVEPKGATYTGLRVALQANGLWLAQTVIDV
jgi:SHS2 domain-containing protein